VKKKKLGGHGKKANRSLKERSEKGAGSRGRAYRASQASELETLRGRMRGKAIKIKRRRKRD